MIFRLKFILVAVGVSFFFSAGSRAADVIIDVPNQDLAGYKFSAIQLNASVPAVDCVVTGPPDTSGTVSITVFLFDSAGAALPYAQVGGNAVIARNMRSSCDVNNGQQTIPQKTVKKIEIQISATATVAANLPVVLP